MSTPLLQPAERMALPWMVATCLLLAPCCHAGDERGARAPDAEGEEGPSGAKGEGPATREETTAAWSRGPGAGFPIAVWLQDPKNAARYRAIGINLYVALWKGPTQEQLATLEEAGMEVVCDQSAYARTQLERRIIVGWMHGDEPDNAQELEDGKGYGPPIAPEKIIADYEALRAVDGTRPILLNLGQGVAWDGWYGRGVRSNHPEDYARYVQGCDIASFDIYPVTHDRPAVAGKLWYVARGVERLRKWCGEARPAWSCIECTRIGNPNRKPTPAEVRAEVWMAIAHGARGIIYFCHQFQPRFIEAALLADEEMAAAVGAINRQVQELAPVLASPTVEGRVEVDVDPGAVSRELAEGLGPRPIATLVKEREGALYILAVRMEPSAAKATFLMKGGPDRATVTVLGEDRTLEARGGRFSDAFDAYGVRLYRVGG